MMQGTTGILGGKLGLQDHGCYHELCRLLGKINATHQLNELCASEQFQVWIEQVYSFTMDSLRHWEVMPNSKHYLLGFWAIHDHWSCLGIVSRLLKWLPNRL